MVSLESHPAPSVQKRGGIRVRQKELSAQTGLVFALVRVMGEQGALLEEMSAEYERAAADLSQVHEDASALRTDRAIVCQKLLVLAGNLKSRREKEILKVVNDAILQLGGRI